MSRLVAADRGALAFAEQLLTVLREGRYTSTYKYAVILGLMDLCLEKSTRTGAAPSSVTTGELARKVIELYWPHARLFQGVGVLRQNTGKPAGILQWIGELRAGLPVTARVSPARARLASPAAWRRLVRKVEWKLVEMPLPRLQQVGNEHVPFIYWIAWDRDIRRGEFSSDGFDNLVRFIGRSGDHLVRLAGLLRPLVCREWAARVARWNDDLVDEPELDRFLFGADRTALRPVSGPLRELQRGRCFYCHDRLSASSQVDHFIPWARYPDDGLDNLVVAHARCNGKKREHLAAAGHVARWAGRMDAAGADVGAIAEEVGWPRHPGRTLAVARSIYLRLPEEARLWRVGDEFEVAKRADLAGALSPGTR